ncbi:UNVERIFIED_CONTAM: hypothetical protein NCL1_44052 [Trichonephila clavipes]
MLIMIDLVHYSVSRTFGLLVRNYSSEYIKLFLYGLENSPRFFGSSPIGCTCEHYSVIADDKLITPTSLVKMCVEDTEKSAMRTLVNGI